MEKGNFSKKLKPLILTLVLVIVDQVTKLWVMKTIPLNSIGYSFFGDFLYICHVRNTGAAFSMGATFPSFVRLLIFIIFPLVIVGAIIVMVVWEKSGLNTFQRWLCAGLAGGGIGTLIDRIFRFDQGVVDFVSVKFYGLFGLERWPTFNVSDSCVVVFVIILAISILFEGKKE
ncbi:MAG: signal peptidase II [Sphaerochaetaceae bacterium]|nr:signal peptidase II [Sphaerochaetaceae bacterium]